MSRLVEARADRAYPREWWCVTGYYRANLKSHVFAGETAHKLRTQDGRLVNKKGQYENWFPTRLEAEAELAKQREAEAYAAKMKRMRDAAPELVEALRKALTLRDEFWESEARALLARIEGDAA
jgi:hypothetical protein